MHLYRRGPVWWVSFPREGLTVRKSTRCRDKKAAQLFARRLERGLADPTHAAANKATVASATARFLTETRRDDVSAGTINMYECKAGHVVRLLGHLRLADLDHARVVRFIDQREEEGAHSHTIHRELTTLRRILKSAARAGEWGRDVKSIMPEYSARYTPRTRYLSCFELAAVMEHLEPGRAAWLAFIVATSARLGEAKRARREDLGADVVLLRGRKTARAHRSVPIIRLFATLIEHVRRHADGPPPLLLRPWGNMRRDIAAACRRAGCEPFTANDLRRTTATWLVQLGVSLDVVAKVLGHANTNMLHRVYGRVDAEDVRQLVEARLM